MCINQSFTMRLSRNLYNWLHVFVPLICERAQYRMSKTAITWSILNFWWLLICQTSRIVEQKTTNRTKIVTSCTEVFSILVFNSLNDESRKHMRSYCIFFNPLSTTSVQLEGMKWLTDKYHGLCRRILKYF